ncbi:hypothetical protein AGMMS50293_24310 [Spirochaetia bacterium]|nr:hypothetical protein AGMMS50293_24310 [Spirochaetia bacterium]
MSELFKDIFKDILKAASRFLAIKSRRRFLLLLILGLAALVEFFVLGLARRTFVFYAIDNGMITVEDRMLKRSSSREVNVTRYVEEALLGPVSPDLLPLFPRETRLRSLLYRDGVVYADFSANAALPPEEGGEALHNLLTLNAGIRRNFSFVKDVRFFIAGKAAYYREFRQIGSAEASRGVL